jgi:hypothetical protein
VTAEGAEIEPLLGLRIDVRPHLVGRTVLDGDFPLIDLILNKKILHLNMFGALRAARLAIRLKQDSTHIVLI